MGGMMEELWMRRLLSWGYREASGCQRCGRRERSPIFNKWRSEGGSILGCHERSVGTPIILIKKQRYKRAREKPWGMDVWPECWRWIVRMGAGAVVD